MTKLDMFDSGWYVCVVAVTKDQNASSHVSEVRECSTSHYNRYQWM